MRLWILFFLITAFLACGGNKSIKLTSSNAGKMADADTLLYSIIPYNQKNGNVTNGAKAATLTGEEIKEIELLLEKAITEHNKINSAAHQRIDQPGKYKKQFVPFTNAKGEKEVWVNCFCSDWGMNWRTEIIMVEDGGSCYFNLTINLTLKSSYGLIVNGIG
jgi:hypothetical protein